MNALILLAAALAVFILGHRFFAKFLTYGVLHLTHGATPPAVHRRDDYDFVPANRWVLLGHHAAAITGILTLVGVGLGAVWGWMPAFLWIVVGSVVAGGTYAVGSLWASLRKSGESLPSVAYEMTGLSAALPLFLLGLLLLVLLSAVLCLLLGQLLYTHPEATWSFLLFMPMTMLTRQALKSGTNQRIALWSAAAVVLFASGVVAGQYAPLQLAGSWSVNMAGADVLSLPHDLVWAALALIPAYLAAKAALPHATRPRGLVMSVLLLALLLLAITGLVVAMPEVVAPRTRDAVVGLPNVWALLFLVITGGALAGFQALLTTGPTVRQLARPGDATMVGYGGVVLDGVFAVVALLAVTAGVATTQDWQAAYPGWPAGTGLNVQLDLVITRLAGFIAVLGIPTSWAVGLVAAVCAGLALTMLENVLRALGFAIGEFVEDFEVPTFGISHFRERSAAVITAVMVIWLSQNPLGMDTWLSLGITSQFFACCVLLLLALAMLRLGRNFGFFLAPFVIIAPLALWGTVWSLLQWWERGAWQWFGLTILAVALGAMTIVITALTVVRTYRERRNSVPEHPASF